jgi:hypothetical protein
MRRKARPDPGDPSGKLSKPEAAQRKAAPAGASLRASALWHGLAGFVVAVIAVAVIIWTIQPYVYFWLDPGGTRMALIEQRLGIARFPWALWSFWSTPGYLILLFAFRSIRGKLPGYARGFFVGLLFMMAYDLVGSLFFERTSCINGCDSPN